jgi:hypothetical protein
MTQSSSIFFLTAAMMAMTGCAPHPGSGTWITAGESEGGFSKLIVQFDGKAEFFAPGREEEVLRCFWAGGSAKSILLDCNPAEDADARLRYSLAVTGADQAELLQSGKIVARFHRSTE